jgi:hypothetical protein
MLLCEKRKCSKKTIAKANERVQKGKMPITINNVRMTAMSIDVINLKIQGGYELIGSTGKVVAKQAFNSYNDIQIEMSRDSKELLQSLIEELTNDIETTIGVTQAIKEL